MYQHKGIAKIEKILHKDFENICDQFVNNELSIHFGDGKTKSVFLISKQRAKNILKLNIRYKEINIKWRVQVTYLACILDESISVQPMTLKAINKTSGESKTFLSKNKLLIPELYKMLFNALIQPHFDYICPAWYPNLIEKTPKK